MVYDVWCIKITFFSTDLTDLAPLTPLVNTIDLRRCACDTLMGVWPPGTLLLRAASCEVNIKYLRADKIK